LVTATHILSTTASNILAIGSWKHSVALSACGRFDAVNKHPHGLERELLWEVTSLLRIGKASVLTLADYLASRGWVNFFIVITRRQTVWRGFVYFFKIKNIVSVYCTSMIQFGKYLLFNQNNFYLRNKKKKQEG